MLRSHAVSPCFCSLEPLAHTSEGMHVLSLLCLTENQPPLVLTTEGRGEQAGQGVQISPKLSGHADLCFFLTTGSLRSFVLFEAGSYCLWMA